MEYVPGSVYAANSTFDIAGILPGKFTFASILKRTADPQRQIFHRVFLDSMVKRLYRDGFGERLWDHWTSRLYRFRKA